MISTQSIRRLLVSWNQTNSTYCATSWCSIHQSTSAAQDSGAKTANVKAYDEIPSKTGRLLPASVELLLSGGPGYLHEHCDGRHKELGPIYRDYLGNIEIVFLSDTKFIQTVVANEGQFPHHNVPEAWNFYNELYQIERGLFFQMGEPWARLRRVFNKVLLADPKSSTRFADDLFRINQDLLDGWQAKFKHHGADITVPDVKAALCNWSIEATGCMLFGSRMGCVQSSSSANHQSTIDDRGAADDRASELVEHVTNMFNETSNFQLIPVRLAHKLNLGTWKRFEEATSGMLRIANLYAAEHFEKVSNNLDSSASLLADMLKLETQLTRDEILRSLVDLIIAAADTTSAALQWMLYLLAKHQDLQSRLFKEVSDALAECSTVDTFKESTPLLRAFIRESLRLYPTAPFLARTLDRDIVLGGYEIPAGKLLVFSLYTTSRSEEYFDDPLEFRPERWLRSADMRTSTGVGDFNGCPHRSRRAYASLPFGIGARMCVGRRAAELQMTTFLASFVSKFHSQLSCGNKDKTKVRLKMILAPTKPISIKLRSRL